MFNAMMWDVVLLLHILGIVTWVGGTSFAVLVTRPSVRALSELQRHNVILAALARLFQILWPVIGLTLVTGWLLVARHGGFTQLPWPIDAMQATALLMAALMVACYLRPYRVARRALRAKSGTIRYIHVYLAAVSLLGIVAIILGVLNAGP